MGSLVLYLGEDVQLALPHGTPQTLLIRQVPASQACAHPRPCQFYPFWSCGHIVMIADARPHPRPPRCGL